MKKGSKVLIVILLLLLIGSCSYIVYDKFFSTNKKIETTQKEKTEDKKVLETTDEKVVAAYNSLINGFSGNCGYFKYFEKDKVLANDIPNKDAFAMVARRLYNLDSDNNYMEETVRKELNKTFGKNYKFKNQDYNICPYWTYDTINKKYLEGEIACGGTCGPNLTKTKITKIFEKSNTIEVYIRVLFYQDNNDYYSSDYIGANKLNFESRKDVLGNTVEFLIEDKDYAKGALFKMTFTKEDGNYIFTSSELVK